MREEEEGREERGSIYSRGTKSCDWPGFDIGGYVASQKKGKDCLVCSSQFDVTTN